MQLAGNWQPQLTLFPELSADMRVGPFGSMSRNAFAPTSGRRKEGSAITSPERGFIEANWKVSSPLATP
jgi:hypothetical protein